ncbi:hypothetical protein L218DRAFT_1007768 [Marasmius fiardii PR-910]|nr:hypothetical protein L218DRAFT_1007768 [Marasmius fiardii PR-910]
MSSQQAEHDAILRNAVGPLNSLNSIFDTALVPLVITLAFYGGYIVLYGICINIIVKRKQDNFIINGILTTALFIAATVGLVMAILAYVFEARASFALAMAFNPLLRSSSDNIKYIIDETGRIIYISWGVEGFSTLFARRMYRTIISATFESGLLYPFILALYSSNMINEYLKKAEFEAISVAHIFYAMLPIVMGVASTLIVVRTALGISVQGERTYRSNIMDERSISLVQFQPRISEEAQDQEVVEVGEDRVNGTKIPTEKD